MKMKFWEIKKNKFRKTEAAHRLIENSDQGYDPQDPRK